jgi:DNA-binding response OmpR family regulator
MGDDGTWRSGAAVKAAAVPRDDLSDTGVRRLTPGKRVLVVDDEPMIGATLRILLRDHDVSVCYGAEEAKALLAERPFDVVLLDLGLGASSGADLHRWIAAEHPDLVERVIVMSGGAIEPEDLRFFEALPPERRLLKPFPPKVLQLLVDGTGPPSPRRR